MTTNDKGDSGSTKEKTENDASKPDEMKLYVWGSGWGLPSIDVTSLQIMAYIRFSGAPVIIEECENPWKSPNGELPFFQHGSKILYTFPEITAYLKQKNYGCDFGLSGTEAADVLAFSQLVKSGLDHAVKYFCWVMESNYVSLIRPCYSRRLPWLYKLWYPDRRLRSEANETIDALYSSCLPIGCSPEPEILEKARSCINTLSDKLGSREFFIYSNSPTILDSIIFSYLAVLLKVPLPDSPVKELIKATPNLERYVTRVLHRYYGSLKGPSGESVTSSTIFGSDGHPTQVKSEDNQYPVSQKILAVSIGVFLMFLFAYKNGMVQFQLNGTQSPSATQMDDEDDDENLIWE